MVFTLRVYKWGDNNLKPEIIQISLLAAVSSLPLTLVAMGICGYIPVSFGMPADNFRILHQIRVNKIHSGIVRLIGPTPTGNSTLKYVLLVGWIFPIMI